MRPEAAAYPRPSPSAGEELLGSQNCMAKRVLILNILLPPAGYLWSGQWRFILPAIVALVLMVGYVWDSYFYYAALEALGYRLPPGWRATWWLKAHWLLMMPWGYWIPMKILYGVVVWHSIRLTDPTRHSGEGTT